MTGPDFKAELNLYLNRARDALVWKLDGASEYDIRRPMTPTGTNLLGLVKHVAGVEIGYFADTFGRPFPESLPWLAEDAPWQNADMWATADETREQITGLYQRVRAHADRTIEELPLDTMARVPWWPPERGEVSLHRIMVHVIAEIDRHAGQADIVRELADGATGVSPEFSNLAEGDQDWWDGYRATLERVAREAAGISE